MEYIEITAKTVEEAITNACTQLGIPSTKLDYEVVEKGSNGIFGLFNSKPAKILARIKEDIEDNSQSEEIKQTSSPKQEINKFKENKNNKPFNTEIKKQSEKIIKETVVEKEDSNKIESNKPSMSEDEIKSRITTFLNSMFGAMNMTVNIDITFDNEDECVNVDLSGDNMGVLIGKRGQTLDSIQYLTSLVLNKDDNKYVRIKLDTENYRNRRKETLESLARNIAYKVKRSRRSVSLEPMNPYERRIIHSALQNDKFVSTRSEGEEPFRHVVVFLDREKSGNKRYNNK